MGPAPARREWAVQRARHRDLPDFQRLRHLPRAHGGEDAAIERCCAASVLILVPWSFVRLGRLGLLVVVTGRPRMGRPRRTVEVVEEEPVRALESAPTAEAEQKAVELEVVW